MKAAKKSKGELMPGTLIECASGRFLAYYEHRTDIIANGDNEKEAKQNLKKLYKLALDFEEKEEAHHSEIVLPPHSKTKSFKERLAC